MMNSNMMTVTLVVEW